MMRNKLKNLAIMFLAVLAIYQTGQLWFGNAPNYNFFYVFWSNHDNSSYKEEKSQFAIPYRIITKIGTNNFQVMYNDLRNRNEINICNQALVEMLKKSELVDTKPIADKDLYNRRSFIYEYAFSVPTDAFAEAFNQKGTLLTSKVKTFDSIIIAPKTLISDTLKVIFVNNEENMYYEYNVSVKNSLNETLKAALDNLELEQSEYKYISSNQSKMPFFRKNDFIFDLTGKKLNYHPVYALNPYEKDGNLLLSTVETQINMFFENSATPPYRYPPINNVPVFTFGIENTAVVKYHQNNTLEYNNYKPSSDQKNKGILHNYSTAVKFIKRDTNVINEYYLTDFREDGDITTFYFDYVINDFMLFLTKTQKSNLGLESFIEVTVENGNVTNYKKYAYTFHIDSTLTETADVDFSKFANQIFLTSDGNDFNITMTGVAIGYKVDDLKNFYLYWSMDMNDGNYIESAKSRQVDAEDELGTS